MVGPALESAKLLENEGITTTVINARFVKPLDEDLIYRYASKAKAIITLEEGCLPGGFGAAVLESLTQKKLQLEKICCLGIPDTFIEHGNRDILLDNIGLSAEKIKQSAIQILSQSSTIFEPTLRVQKSELPANI